MRDFVITLLICSVTMSALALLYMAITPLLTKYYSAKGRYYAWLVVVIGLIIPFRPQFHNAFIQVDVPGETAVPVIQAGNRLSAAQNVYTAAPDIVIPSAGPTITWWQIAAAIWLVGVVVFLAYHGVRHYRFIKMVRRWREVITDERTLTLLQNLKSEMGISKRINIYLCPGIGSPMMIGFINPQILLPKIESAQDELRFILRHELVHFKRKDLWYKMLVLAATAIHWFNPVVYMMARVIDRQCELSCDAAVVDNKDIDTRQYYSETIIGIVRYKSKRKTSLSTNFNGGKKGMKNRISSIMDTGRKKTGVVIICAVLTLTMATGAAFSANASEQKNNGQIDRQSNAQTVVESDMSIMSRFDPATGKTYYSWDFGNTWTPLTSEEYDAMFPSLEWWTYDEYKEWMEEQIEALQSLADDGVSDYYDKEGVLREYTQKDVDEAAALYQSILEDIKNGLRVSKTTDDLSGTGILYSMNDTMAEQENIRIGIETIIKPYEPFGVSYDSETCVMMYDGHPVREIYDPKDGELITITAGTGFIGGVIPDGAIDLTAVYSNDMLSGLKVSTQEEFETRTRERLSYRDTFIMEAESTSSSLSEPSEHDYSKYAGFGLIFDKTTRSLYYDGKLVRYFEDYYSLGENMSAGIDYFNKDGTIDVHGIRDFSQIEYNADGSYDPSGKLVGVEAYSQAEFEARDIEALTNPSQSPVVTYAAIAESDEYRSNNQGMTIAQHLEKYKKYGISFEENGTGGAVRNIYYNGQHVKTFYDEKPDGGIFMCSSYDGGDITVCTVYDESGKLTGVEVAPHLD